METNELAASMENTIRFIIQQVIEIVAIDKCETDKEAGEFADKMLKDIRDRFHKKYDVSDDTLENSLKKPVSIQELWNDFYKPELKKLLD